MKKVFFLFLSLIFLVGCTSKGEQSNCSKTRKPKNVIYLIGDGMGLNQLYAGMTANGGTLNIERCTHTGLAKTYSANSYITDSAARNRLFDAFIKALFGGFDQPLRFIGNISASESGGIITVISLKLSAEVYAYDIPRFKYALCIRYAVNDFVVN